MKLIFRSPAPVESFSEHAVFLLLTFALQYVIQLRAEGTNSETNQAKLNKLCIPCRILANIVRNIFFFFEIINQTCLP